MSSIKKNFCYNIIYQVLLILLPLITAPYLSRTVGAEGIGIYSYTYSIVQYFVLFAKLGLNNYGNRTIAQNRQNREQLSKTFSSIYALQLITSGVAIIAYILYLILFSNQYKIYSIIQIIFLISAMLDISWLFFGLEKFKITVMGNTIINVLSCISILIFVNGKSDLYIYTFILSITSLLTQILLWLFTRKYVDFVSLKWSDIKEHIRPNLILFIPVIAISLYNIMDKIMLGKMVGVNEVGIYENAERIINVPITLISALGTVMLPRISNLICEKNDNKVMQYFNKTMEFVIFISIPICFGLMAVGEKFAPLYFGEQFVKTGYLIKLLSCVVLFKAIANVIRTQYLIPNHRDFEYVVSVILGAIVNVISNLILISKYQSVGAVIGTIFAEFTVMIYQIYAIRKEMNIKKYIIDYIIKFIFSGIAMYIIVSLIDKIIFNSYLIIFVQIICGVMIYFILNIKYLKNNIYKIIKKDN